MALTGEGVVLTEGGLTPETLSGDSAPAMPLLRVCLLPRPPSAASAGARGSQSHPTRRDAGGSGRGLSWARVPAISGQTLSPPGATDASGLPGRPGTQEQGGGGPAWRCLWRGRGGACAPMEERASCGGARDAASGLSALRSLAPELWQDLTAAPGPPGVTRVLARSTRGAHWAGHAGRALCLDEC
ncbi:BH3-interacting domain death agonist isoform X2 [Balaenoptera musculus]|uniref:BH3-interacting domain death agonist isoform X2 n=1 Tax=Balaenoptera musculus TaxID=9771 RepID=A0A8B8YH65_BALMU|nr:BH3-interacting domain death agonist isoform X2 [Balaenoptera musculus]